MQFSSSERAPAAGRHLDNDQWIAGLRAGNVDVLDGLHEMLVRIARSDVRRRAAVLRLAGPELEDIAQQAADDALLAITVKLDEFRGESRFTTWAYKFVVYEVGTKINRHRWHRETLVPPDHGWEVFPDRLGVQPEASAEQRELVGGVRHAVAVCLTDKQRTVFLALVVQGMPVDVLAEQMSTSRGAVYKVMFDARRKIRAALVADGLIDGRRDACEEGDAP